MLPFHVKRFRPVSETLPGPGRARDFRLLAPRESGGFPWFIIAEVTLQKLSFNSSTIFGSLA